MKVSVTRTGGFAGMARTWSCQADPAEWAPLLEALPWHERPRRPDGVDRYQYRIQVSRRRITLPEQQVEGPWRELVERVRRDAE